MSKRLWVLGLTLAGCACLLVGLSRAADEKKEASKDDDPSAQAEPDPQGDVVAQIALATKLEEYGRQVEDRKVGSLALVTAATILRNADKPKEGTIKPTVEGGSGEAKSAGYDPAALVKQSDDLLAAALKKSHNDETIQKLADRAKKGTTRGGLNGPMEYHMTLRRGQTDTYNLKFTKNAWARIAIRQEGDSRLYLEVVNSRGNVRGNDGGRNPVVGFMPHQADGTDFVIHVKNNGPGDTYYFLFTN